MARDYAKIAELAESIATYERELALIRNRKAQLDADEYTTMKNLHGWKTLLDEELSKREDA